MRQQDISLFKNFLHSLHLIHYDFSLLPPIIRDLMLALTVLSTDFVNFEEGFQFPQGGPVVDQSHLVVVVHAANIYVSCVFHGMEFLAYLSQG